MSMKREEFEARIVAKAQQDPAFYEALVKDPKGALERELREIKADLTFPEGLKVTVVEETPEQIFLRLPVRADILSEEELGAVSGGGDGMDVGRLGIWTPTTTPAYANAAIA